MDPSSVHADPNGGETAWTSASPALRRCDSSCVESAPRGAPASGGEDHDGAVTRWAEAWIDDAVRRASPFFVMVGLRKPHTPFEAPPPFYAAVDAASAGAPPALAARQTFPIGTTTGLAWVACRAIARQYPQLSASTKT